MKIQIVRSFTAVLLFMAIHAALAQGTAFNYEGRLNDTGQPANGMYDFRFTIYDSTNVPGTVIASPVTNSATGVTNGLFSVTLDFGAGVFNGPPRWLEIAARTNGGGSFVTLSPRQQLTAAPYAIMANATSNLLGTLPAGQLSGTVPSGGLGGTYTGQLTLNNPLNHLCGDGSCLTGVNASLLDGLDAANFWQLTGNAGTVPGVNFVGTKDNQPLELHVNNVRALRLEPGASGGNNVIGGFGGNYVSPGLAWATIAGGGILNATNRVTGSGGTIGGGANNWASDYNSTISGGANNSALVNASYIGGGSENYAHGDHSVIAGGQNNMVNDSYSTIGGGGNNSITNGCWDATIGGGNGNIIQPGSHDSTIGGGYVNTIQSSADTGTIAGGAGNNIGTGAYWSTIGGGLGNGIHTNAYQSTIAGGVGNTVQFSAADSFIGAGNGNLIGTNAGGSAIGGGYQNTVQLNASYSAIVGGQQNVVGDTYSFIGAGTNNLIQPGAPDCTIAGGAQNAILSGAAYSSVGGGQQNVIQNGTGFEAAWWSVIAGGQQNTIQANAGNSFIGGGGFNNIGPACQGSTIAGGLGNTIQVVGVSDVGFESTISGGNGNTIAGAYLAGIGGGSGNSIGDASHYSFIGGGGANSVGTNAEFSCIGGGWANVIQANATGVASLIAGGYGNTIQSNANSCTIGGGSGNIILSSSAYATIPGGSMNKATAGFTFAAGHAAQALYNGDFVWADNSLPGPPLPTPFVATGPNQFLIRAAGGVGIGTNNPHGEPLMMGGGAYCTGSFWVNTCDRNVKEDFSAIAPREILSKVVAMPITQWKYKSEPTGVKHLGPVAQDFHEAFGLGDSDKAIGTVDEGGVALAAIQGLNGLLEEKDAQLKRLVADQAQQLKAKENTIHDLERRLERLEQAFHNPAPRP